MSRIKELRLSKKLNMAQTAKELNIPYTTYVNYEKGIREPNSEMLIQIAKFFDVTIDYLIGRSNSNDIKNISEPIAEKNTHKKGAKIPVIGTVAAGIPIYAYENIIDYEEISEEMAATGEYFALKIKGDSMAPRILEGDVVIVKKQSDVDSGDIAIVLINGDEATVKCLKKQQNGIILTAYNPDVWEPKFFSNKEIEQLPVSVIGKVVELRGKF